MTDKEIKEEEKIQQEGERASFLVKSEDWQWAKKKLLQRVSNLDSVNTIKEEGDVGLEIKARKQTIAIIIDWLDDIEGIAQQHREQSPNKMKLKEVEEEDYIHENPEEE